MKEVVNRMRKGEFAKSRTVWPLSALFLLAAAACGPRPTPPAVATPTAPPAADVATPAYITDALSAFPLAVGATWEYAVEARYAPAASGSTTTGPATWSGTLTARVVDSASSQGHPTFEMLTTLDPEPPSEVLIPAGTTTYQVTPEGVLERDNLAYQFPLRVDAAWLAFPSLPESQYQWRVTQAGDVTTPFQEFKGCYELTLITGPDTTIDWFCNGVGLVKRDYLHHGGPPEWYWTLTSFSPG